MIPKIKKRIKNFLLDETGKISKQSLLKMGSMIFIASAMADITKASADCPGHHCNLLWGEPDSELELVGDEQIIVDNEYGNLIADERINLNQQNEHTNCELWWNNCKVEWTTGTPDHTSHFSGTYQWECSDRWDDSKVDHWNAAHHLNDIGLSSEDNLKIIAEHSNYVATVNRDIYARDVCGSQHSSGD